jgi:hypothetical protein
LKVDLGFAGKRPADREFKVQVESEIAQLQSFLDLKTKPLLTA